MTDAPQPALHRGDALAWLTSLGTATAAAVITDPPYSSGGMLRSDRNASTRRKYSGLKSHHHLPDFTGDNRDPRSWGYWMALWLGEAARVVQPGGVLAMFTDWRQLPAASDALQAGGWVWRGIVPWIKPDARPQLGRFTQNAEFLVWGTNGPRPFAGPCLPGYYVARAPRATDPGAHRRRHLTQKPLDLLRSVVRVVEPGALVLDPFAGAGTTLLAAALEGRHAAGCELDPVHHQTALDRLAEAADPGPISPTALDVTGGAA
ncbi:DNA methyltransferase [Streptomyces sp. B1866]|uniref:DNA-methyltransferase n=1 Tax=Streptomyces sp. B1866 TaxID=3075431 RepID=UPI0028922ED2|nr:DNA methyltransferase [Streptomyces sp. B1866]MDT3395576.1 DNA methyltransferase [Streptomyces sp. B1866]